VKAADPFSLCRRRVLAVSWKSRRRQLLRRRISKPPARAQAVGDPGLHGPRTCGAIHASLAVAAIRARFTDHDAFIPKMEDAEELIAAIKAAIELPSDRVAVAG